MQVQAVFFSKFNKVASSVFTINSRDNKFRYYLQRICLHRNYKLYGI